MAKCDEGYLCEVCGDEVEGIQHSDLYLRFVIGEMDPERLHTSPERHILCNPVLAQFIDSADITAQLPFDAIPDGFARADLDPEYAQTRGRLVTCGYNRLAELANSADELPIHQYPLEEVRQRWQ